MKCPVPGCTGRLRCRSTRESDRPGRTLRYRHCDTCRLSCPTIETVLSIRSIPAPPPPLRVSPNSLQP